MPIVPFVSGAPWPLVLSTTPIEEERRVQVLVPDNSIGQALKVLQKKMQREGIFREMKLRGHYEPSERRVREKAKAAPPASSLAARGVCCR
jgi:small subunit ribosomal protein S21